MWYWVVCGLFAIWVLVDSLKRKAKTILWVIGTVLLGPIILPVYIATRPLKTNEVREGGTAWNIFKNFVLFWTTLMVVAAIWCVVVIGKVSTAPEITTEGLAKSAGATLGLPLIAALWFFPTLGALLLGFFLKKSSVVEKGPTGPLASKESPKS